MYPEASRRKPHGCTTPDSAAANPVYPEA